MTPFESQIWATVYAQQFWYKGGTDPDGAMRLATEAVLSLRRVFGGNLTEDSINRDVSAWVGRH